ncbi:MAG TPA: tRNA pseudouridine(55) synthase TruB [Firmicutes bacterium]|nr:tRNA pseudouridine(55) synthase TruB [Bacillota bacterium]
MNGFLNILKPPGMTSHDVVNHIRKKAAVKTGHTGTLDPAAAGVLVLALGKATKLAAYVAGEKKEYRVELKLGTATDTFDATGIVTATKTVPPLNKMLLSRVLESFRGPQKQIPPMYSALHYKGKRLYQLAREGKEVARPPRDINIYSLDCVQIKTGAVIFDVSCSAGTYIRTLCVDIAAKLGTVGHMSFLVRKKVGCFAIDQASILEGFQEAGKEALERALYPLEYPFKERPFLELEDAQAVRFKNGGRVEIKGPLIDSGIVRVFSQGIFIALGKTESSLEKTWLSPLVVLG